MNIRFSQRVSLYALAVPAMVAAFLGFTSSAYAADTVGLAYFVDGDNDGTVDHAEYIFDENIDQCDFELGDWSIDVAGTIGITAITGINTSGVEAPGSGTCNGTDGRVYLTVTATPNVTGGSVAPVISYTNQGTLGSLSGVTTAQISDQTEEALTDWVAPTIASVSPADESTGQSRNQDIVITFSEPMVTTFNEGTQFAISPDPGSFTAEWSSGNTMLTLNGPNFACNRTYTVTTDEDEMDAATGAVAAFNVNGAQSGDWSFTTNTCPRSGTTTQAPSSIEVTPFGVDMEFLAGSTQMISWDTVSGGGFVDIWYSHDGGINYALIAHNAGDDGAHEWIVPTQVTEQGVIKVDATDLVMILASDTSSTFSVITSTSTDGGSEQIEIPAPATEEVREVEGVQPNTYIVGTSFDAVYYVDSQLIRHPFLNEQIFFTWQTDFSEVQRVPDATLALLKMGSSMLPKPNTKLVKIESDASVYAVELNPVDEFSPLLRKIDSEATAATLFGADWAARVIDVPVTLFTKYTRGTELVSTL